MTQDKEAAAQAVGSVASHSQDGGSSQAGAARPAARRLGRKPDRRPKLSEQQRAAVVDAVLSGQRTAAQMAREFKVSEPTVSRILAAHRAGARSSGSGDVQGASPRRAERVAGVLPLAALDGRIAIVGRKAHPRKTAR